MNKYMKIAIEEARSGISYGHGGPFGAVIVYDGEVVARAHNCTLLKHDATCHGEIMAIRQASRALRTHDLSGCELYTTGEPCPMCLAACLWANISKVYYGCSLVDNDKIGFRDLRFDQLLGGREQMNGFLECIDRDACLELFEEYNKLDAPRY